MKTQRYCRQGVAGFYMVDDIVYLSGEPEYLAGIDQVRVCNVIQRGDLLHSCAKILSYPGQRIPAFNCISV